MIPDSNRHTLMFKGNYLRIVTTQPRQSLTAEQIFLANNNMTLKYKLNKRKMDRVNCRFYVYKKYFYN